LKVAYIHYFVIVALLVDQVPNLIFVPLLPIGLEIMVPSLAIYGIPTHLISSLVLEKSMVLD
jgi:hypothetical protein